MREFTGYQKGVDLGGWLSQCGEGNYTEERFNTFIREEDIAKIAGWGLDHVRLPIDYNVLQTEEGDFIESGFGHVDQCIEWCRKYGLKVVLDLHKTRGFVFDDASYCSFFDDASLQDQFIRLWEEITRRYAQYHDMVAFELLNEVTEREMAEKWNRISARTVDAIRKLNQDVRIIIGGIYNSSIFGLTLLEAPKDRNIVYTFHCYSPMIFTHQRAGWVAQMPADYVRSYPGTVEEFRAQSREIFGEDYDGEFAGLDEKEMNEKYFDKIFQQALEVAEKYDVPLYCGEYGVIDLAAPEDALAWYRDIHAVLEKYRIPRAAWSYKSMNFGLSDEWLAGVLPELLKYL